MNVMIISDFVEGQPVVASVRYEQLMKHIGRKFNKTVINDREKGCNKSVYSDLNLKYSIVKSRYTQSIGKASRRTGLLQKVLRLPFILQLWRMYSYSEYRFRKANHELLSHVDKLLSENSMDCIFATVPDIHALYIVKHIKQRFFDIPVIVEVRDILDTKLGKGNPGLIFKRAERILCEYADGIIALSEGISEHYNLKSKKPIEIIKNGYDLDDFKDCEYAPLDRNKEVIVFSHIGSIYKGRNLKDFIGALITVSEKLNKRIAFNIIGYLDNEALDDISCMDSLISESKVRVCITGTLPHEEAVEYLKQSDVAVILTHRKGSEYAIPGKTFEYIGACKPTIAVTHDKALINLIDGRYGECSGHNAVSISEKVFKLLETEYSFSDRFRYSRKRQLIDILRFCKKINKFKNKLSDLRSEKENNANFTLFNRTTTF